MNSLFSQLADQLGGSVFDQPYDGCVRISVEGVMLYLWLERSGARLFAEIARPRFINDRGEEEAYYGRPGSQVRISMSPSRPMAHLRNDIRRRLLPQARETYPVWKAAADAITERNAAAGRFRGRLVALRGRETNFREVVDARSHTIGGRGGPRWAAVDIVGESCTLKIHSVSPDLAEAIILLIDEWREPGERAS